jgi:hypothetical protein
MIYSKGEPTHFNADPGRTPQKQYDKRAFKGPNRGKASSHPLGAWPTDVWSDVKHVGNNHGEKVDHPAQFSRQLARKIIEMYTICDALVLDPFSGSGTTQIVCAQQGRAFIGADLYYEDVRNEALAGIRAEAARPTPCLTCKAVGPHRHFPGVTAESADFWSEELARERAGLRAPWRAIAKRVDIPVPTLFEMASGE